MSARLPPPQEVLQSFSAAQTPAEAGQVPTNDSNATVTQLDRSLGTDPPSARPCKSPSPRRRRDQLLNDAYFGQPPVLEGEETSSYVDFLAKVSDHLGPENVLEMIWVRDVVDLQWEIDRLRRVKAALIDISRRNALESVLRPLQLVAASWAKKPEDFDPNDSEDVLDRLVFRQDEAAIANVAEILEARGQWKEAANLGEDALLANGMTLMLEKLERFDRMIMAMEARRDNALRELDRRRAGLGGRTRRALEEVEDAEFQEVGETPTDQKQAA